AATTAAEAQFGVFQIDWDSWGKMHPKLARDRRFSEVLGNPGTVGSGPSARIRGELRTLSPEDGLKLIEVHLQETLASILKMGKGDVPVNQKLNELGVDSLMVLELGLGVREKVGVSLSAMEFLKGPTISQLAFLVDEKLRNPEG
ncbi:MAG: acyl carrier protein, partial [Chthoniobacterales bacterium]